MREFGEKIDGAAYFYRPGSYAVIAEGECVAVVRLRRSGKYFLIGGGINAGETKVEALHREALEEIGCEIEISEKLGAGIEYFYAETDAQYIAKECHFYHARLLAKISEPESDLIWLEKERLGEMRHGSHRWIAARALLLTTK